eukprot:9195517-Alexandrium_andersonii.AAC.1
MKRKTRDSKRETQKHKHALIGAAKLINSKRLTLCAGTTPTLRPVRKRARGGGASGDDGNGPSAGPKVSCKRPAMEPPRKAPR